MGDQFFFGCRRPVAGDDERDRGLAPLLMGDADYGAFENRSMLEEAVFDLRAADVLAPGDQNSVASSLHVNVALPVDGPHVRGAQLPRGDQRSHHLQAGLRIVHPHKGKGCTAPHPRA